MWALMALMAGLLAGAGCERAVLRGRVIDTHGRPIPGVAVTVAGGVDQAVANALGEYQIKRPPDGALLLFAKTGYAPAELLLERPDAEAPPVVMWRLPASQGVYLYEQDRFIALAPIEPERLYLQEGGIGYGVRRPPETVTFNPAPAIVTLKMPRDGARLSRLERRSAALGSWDSQPHRIEAWAAEESVPADLRTLDEPEQLLQEARLPGPLEPGVYALHWGALDGYTTIETRMFYFRVEPLEEEDDEAPDEDTPEPAEE